MTKKFTLYLSIAIFLTLGLSSCGYHTKHFMFKTENSILKSDSSLFENLSKNYVLRKNDRFKMNIYSNNGEILVDPNKDLLRAINQGRNGIQNLSREQVQYYTISGEGEVKFPMLGWIKSENKTIFELEQLLQEKYSEFYVDAFVRLELMNRRVFYFSKDGGKVIPLDNENMSLIEVMALAQEGTKGSNLQEIKIIRGELNDPEVLKIDLSTIDGLKSSNLTVRANDIIYVKPTRNAVNESIRDASPVISIISSTITTLAIIISFTTK